VGVVGVVVQELGDVPGHVGGAFEQEQVSAAGHDVQPGVRDAVREDPRRRRPGMPDDGLLGRRGRPDRGGDRGVR
jgi:hypothetical protein